MDGRNGIARLLLAESKELWDAGRFVVDALATRLRAAVGWADGF